jgi:sialic acid synthase SpsE
MWRDERQMQPLGPVPGTPAITIGDRTVGTGFPVLAIAEIGLNHGGSPQRALAMVDAAADAGASAIKLQSLEAHRLVSETACAPAHVKADSLRAFFARFELDWNAHEAVVARAHARGLLAMTTPFAVEAVPVLDAMGFDAFKIASGDLTFLGLIAAVAATGRPLVMSTGMSDLGEVHQAVRVARSAGARQLALLHCVSAYPTPVSDENLRAVATLGRAFPMPVGLSDHGRGLPSAITAVALGASIYERHFVLAGDADALDRAVSSEPDEFAAIVAAMAETQRALGDGVKACRTAERPNVRPSRRGLYATRTLNPGDVISAEDIAVLRPAGATDPADLPALLGTTVRRTIVSGGAFEPADLRVGSAA